MSDAYMKSVIAPGDQVSRMAYDVCTASYRNCPAVTVFGAEGEFRGDRGFLWRPHILVEMSKARYDRRTGELRSWVMRETVANDGAGSKPQFFTLVGTPDVFRDLGREIITMTADDLARKGNFPAIMVNEMNIKRLTPQNLPLVEAAIQGYGQALSDAQLVNITGETAVMKFSVASAFGRGTDGELALTWGASCIGLSRHDRAIDTTKIEPGMMVMGMHEPGYRCNGGTFFTNLIRATWGMCAGINPDAIAFARKLCVPSRSYARILTKTIGWNDDGSVGEPLAKIYGAAHITGGGVWGKFGEILPDGVGAELYLMPEPAPVLREAQLLSLATDAPLSDWEAYSTLHGGCGMLVVCWAPDAPALIVEAYKQGVTVSYVGKTVASPTQEILIRSRFKDGKILSSHDPN